MPDDARVQELLDELLDLEATPEEVCSSCPELLPVVRDRWRQMCRARDDLDVLFPPLNDLAGCLPKPIAQENALPTIPDYEVMAMLGAGGMGVVFKARHLRLNRVVALKMALAGVYAGPQERQRFQQEAEAVAALRHPNVVQIYEVGEADGRPYFTMEYLDGGSLAQRLAGTPQSAIHSATLLLSLAEAVDSAHQAGIVHRDLKPANVLLTGNGVAKISDFGVARRLGAEAGLTRTGTAVGTPSYMAPEQARGVPRAAGPAVDIYSLGAILYELLTGRPPFLAETVAQTVFQLLSVDPVPPSKLVAKVPRDLETICLKCLQKEPRLRYATAGALADDINRFRAGLPIAARRLGWSGRSWRWCRRNPALAALVGTLVILAGSAVGGGVWMQHQEANRREETARNQGRAWQAVDAALDKSASLREHGRWPEMRASLEGTEELLDAATPVALRERVRQARADATMVAELEEIRLRLSTGGTALESVALSPDEMYARAFREYGIDVMKLDLKDAETRIRASDIRDTLLAFLHDWLFWAAERERVRAVIERADDDPWRREFRSAVAAPDSNKLKELAVAPAAAAQPAVLISGLGGSLLAYHQRPQALTLLNEAQKRHPEDFWINYLLGHCWDQDRPQEAVGYFRAAVAIRPSSDQAYSMLGKALRASGDLDGAVAAFRQATALNTSSDVGRDLAMLLVPTGNLEEARICWGKYLDSNPPIDDAWYGYAPLCLYLGNESAYQLARTALLDHYKNTNPNWIAAERAGLACLLLPASDQELPRIISLVDRALADGPKPPQSDFAYLQYLSGMAKYRQGRAQDAIPLLQEAALALSNRAGPKLALAMAQYQSGYAGDARRTLADVLLAFDWKAPQNEPAPMWVSHVIRREAQQVVLPKLDDFLRGIYQPQDRDELDALLGASRFADCPLVVAEIYADAFFAAPNLVEDLRLDHRYHAACSAARASNGQGKDTAELSETDQARLRSQARAWLREALTVFEKALDSDPSNSREKLRRQLARWQADSDLASLRNFSELQTLSEEERTSCLELWAEVAAMLKRCDSGE